MSLNLNELLAVEDRFQRIEKKDEEQDKELEDLREQAYEASSVGKGIKAMRREFKEEIDTLKNNHFAHFEARLDTMEKTLTLLNLRFIKAVNKINIKLTKQQPSSRFVDRVRDYIVMFVLAAILAYIFKSTSPV